MDDVRAHVKGDRLVVSLPFWQIFVLVGALAFVLGGVWLTTDRLARTVSSLTTAVGELRTSFTSVADRTTEVETQIRILRDRSEREERGNRQSG